MKMVTRHLAIEDILGWQCRVAYLHYLKLNMLDRVAWLYENRNMIGGLTFVEEPSVLRFFFGKLTTTSNWQSELVAKFRADFGDSL